MFFPSDLDHGGMKETRLEADSLAEAGLDEAQAADLESGGAEQGEAGLAADREVPGLELSEAEIRAIDEAAAMPLEAMLEEKAYVTARCEGCVGNHVGTGVRVTVHGS